MKVKITAYKSNIRPAIPYRRKVLWLEKNQIGIIRSREIHGDNNEDKKLMNNKR